MKSILRKVVFLIVVLGTTTLMAQPPMPGQTSGGSGTTASPNSSKGINRSSPIGTATLLMMTMGGAFLGYKVKKSKKDKEEK